MGKVWYPQSEEVIQQWIDAILAEASDKLSSWESDFIDSCQQRLNLRGSLTERMEISLEKIYAEKTA